MICWRNHYHGRMHRGYRIECYTGNSSKTPEASQANVNFKDFERVEMHVNGIWWRPYMQGRGKSVCPECHSPFVGNSHFGDCRIANGMKPDPRS